MSPTGGSGNNRKLMNFRQLQYSKEMGALQMTLKGIVAKMVKKECGSKAPKIGCFDTYLKGLI